MLTEGGRYCGLLSASRALIHAVYDSLLSLCGAEVELRVGGLYSSDSASPSSSRDDAEFGFYKISFKASDRVGTGEMNMLGSNHHGRPFEQSQ